METTVYHHKSKLKFKKRVIQPPPVPERAPEIENCKGIWEHNTFIHSNPEKSTDVLILKEKIITSGDDWYCKINIYRRSNGSEYYVRISGRSWVHCKDPKNLNLVINF
jgi:hypothetical protein